MSSSLKISKDQFNKFILMTCNFYLRTYTYNYINGQINYMIWCQSIKITLFNIGQVSHRCILVKEFIHVFVIRILDEVGQVEVVSLETDGFVV